MHFKTLLITAFLSSALFAQAQDEEKQKALEISGFAMTDFGYNFKQINPAWFDALRITKLPSYKGQFAPDGQVFFGVRQTRFGVKGYTQTPVGELKTHFEFDLFGVGVDEGQTTMRIRYAYGEIGRLLVGQAASPFMDGDIWPNTAEYWGPSGMVFYRNVQVRYAPVVGNSEVFVALERPGASADKGSYESHIELDSVKGHQILPDFSAHYKQKGSWGHFQLAGILRPLKWKDVHTTGIHELNGSVLGWGLNLSTALNLGKMDVFKGSVIYGEGVENYMQDAPVDVGVKQEQGKPLTGKALPVTGICAFLDHSWSSKWASSIGYSSVNIKNTDQGSPNAYRMGEYVIVNLSVTPFANAWMVAEYQWGKRQNFTDGFASEATKIHFAFKYNFSQIFYRNNK